MTPDSVIRLAARHWYDRLLDGDASLDYDGQMEELEAALGIERT